MTDLEMMWHFMRREPGSTGVRKRTAGKMLEVSQPVDTAIGFHRDFQPDENRHMRATTV